MNRPRRASALMIDMALALCGGLALRDSIGLHPTWWLAWLAPVPILAALLRSTPWTASALALLAGLVASSANFPFFALLMPLPAALLVTALTALPCVLVMCLFRWAAARTRSPWTVLVWPLLWSAADTLLAHGDPDGNWGSLAYSQAGFLPVAQVMALAGTAGVVFLVSLPASVLAFGLVRGWRTVRIPAGLAAACVVASVAYGALRIPPPAPVTGALVGLAVIDDFMGPRTPPAYNARIWAQYERHVATLAGQGARIVVLPEKIAVLAPAAADLTSTRLGALARRTGVWLVAGVGIDDGRTRRNLAWLFGPDGRLDITYQKHHMAPPEREFAPGSVYDLRTIAGTRYGLAVCKDMHFAEMGRAYGTRGAAAMLVPAWDFGMDGAYAARLSALRGVESGFAMVRASREGLLTVSDAYGRITAAAPSARLPGATLLARLPGPSTGPTFYAVAGDWFGWTCVLCVSAMLVSLLKPGKKAVKRAPQGDAVQ